MLGVVIILLLSWLLLYWLDKSSFSVLGIELNKGRLILFLTCFFITAILCSLDKLLELVLSGGTMEQSADFTFRNFGNAFWWDFKSVLTEELIFRGAIFYLLYKRWSSSGAIYLTMASFGVYHWFSFNLFWQIVPMLVIFIGTAFMAYAFAMSFVKTQSIYAPLGLHLGWNFTLNSIFGSGPHGFSLFTIENGSQLSSFYSLFGLILIPLFLCFLVHKLPYQKILLQDKVS